ncbi:MAG: trigger factor [Spirochaetales bacterium]|nr:trigger factor [Spirochaetales bacterium]
MENYEKTFEKLEKSAVKMTLTFPAAAVQEAYGADLAKYARQLTIPGFRKGKAPVSIIESKFGDTIINETFTNMLDKAVEAIFSPKEGESEVEEQYRPLDNRAMNLANEDEIFPIKKGQDIVCQIKYDVYPQFELGTYKGLTVEYPFTEYDPKSEDAEIESIRTRNAVIQEKSGSDAAVGDIATIDLAELAADGTEIADSKKDAYVFTLSDPGSAPYDFDSDIVGMKVGETKQFEKTYAEQSAWPGQTKTWKVTLTKLKVRVLPELDDDFAQDVSEDYKTMADMREAVHKKCFEQYEEQAKAAKVDAILTAVEKATAIEVPELMIANSLEEKWYGFVQNFTGNGQRSFADAEKYLEGMGMTRESYVSMMGERFGEENVSEIKKSLILEKIQQVEKTAEEDESKIDAFIAENKIDVKQYGEAYEPMVRAQIKEQLGRDNAIKLLTDSNTFVRVDPKPMGTTPENETQPESAGEEN